MCPILGEAGAVALYPPTVTPPVAPLGVPAFVAKFVRNPLTTLPKGCWEAPITIIERRFGQIVWIADPALIETVLLVEAEQFPKAKNIEERVFGAALGRGLLTADGASWRQQRRAAAPAFRHGELLACVPGMARAGAQMAERWQAAGIGEARNIERDMTDATFDVIAATVLGGCDAATARLVKSCADAYLQPISWDVAFGILQLPSWLWYPGKGRQRAAARRLRKALAEIIAARRREAGARDDLLGRLMSARGADGTVPLNGSELVDNLATFLVAGHETTAKALTWTLYLLARAPDWQDKVRAEAAMVLGPRAAVTAEDLDKLVITEMVAKEAMRLYPPAPVISRAAAQDCVLGGRPIRKGALITIPIYCLHRHRQLWSDPDRFDPERFAPGKSEALPRTQFMPFGFGQRTCIGAAFAMIEAKVLLAMFVKAARFTCDRTLAPEPISRVTLRPKGGMPLRVMTMQEQNTDFHLTA